MGNLSQAKMLGGIGSIILLVGGFIPVMGMILPIIGLILVIIAINYIKDETQDQGIFKNYILYFILTIIALVAVFGIIMITLGLTGFSLLSLIESGGVADPTEMFTDIATLLSGCLSALFVGWILLIIAAIFLRKSFNAITLHTKVGLFSTTGLIFLIGAGTLIIGIGAIIILLAFILQIVAFFSLPDTLPDKDVKKDSGRRCPNCGRSIPEDARACPYCAKRFEE